MSDLLRYMCFGVLCISLSACKDTSTAPSPSTLDLGQMEADGTPSQADRGPSVDGARGDTGARSDMGQEPSTDMGQEPSSDMGQEPSSDMGQEPSSDMRVGLDAAVIVGDASIRVDLGQPMPIPDGGQGEELPYRGMRMAPVESPLYITPAYLALTAVDEMYFSILVGRLLPRVDGMGDTSHLQPWLMYRPSNESSDWVWLMMAFYLPEAAVARLPEPSERVQVGRAGPWHGRANGAVAAIANDAIGPLLANDAAGFVCGGARVAARFNLKLADGQTIENVVGVAMTISRTQRLDLAWLRGCDRNSLP